jgi:hypothetical protein
MSRLFEKYHWQKVGSALGSSQNVEISMNIYHTIGKTTLNNPQNKR